MPSTLVICFRVSPETKREIANKAEKLGVTLAEYCQMEITRKEVSKSEPVQKEVKVRPVKVDNSPAVRQLILEISRNRFLTAEVFKQTWWKRYREILKDPSSPPPEIKRPVRKKIVKKK